MIHHAAVDLVNNPPPLLEQVFEEHRARFGPRDLEREVERQLILPVEKALDVRYYVTG